MSGTSMDGVDTALVDCAASPPQLLAAAAHPYPAALSERLARFVAGPRRDAESLWTLDVEVAESFAASALELLESQALARSAIVAIGSHGQTVAHAPLQRPPYTVQIGDPNVIAERTGITTVADFRRRDIAAGGQGAPLAPAFHALAFARRGHVRAVVNIGGIANITVLGDPDEDAVIGYDTGPGNALMNEWIARHHGHDFDARGDWAASGTINRELLAALLADPYFSAPAPKSTGRDHFHLDWLEQHMPVGDPPPAAADVQRTLCELTALSVAHAVRAHRPADVLLCGGGVHNELLVSRIAELVAPCGVTSTGQHGVDPDWVEATAFAWLAARTVDGLSGNAPAVTGARHLAVLGAVHHGVARTTGHR